MSKLEEWIDEQIKEVEEDERFHYKPANVIINAPLALIQVGLDSQMRVLKKVKELLNE